MSDSQAHRASTPGDLPDPGGAADPRDSPNTASIPVSSDSSSDSRPLPPPLVSPQPSDPIPLSLLPETSTTNSDGCLEVGGCDVLDLVREFGTPLFVYDEQHIRLRCREAITAFDGGAVYASKAFLCSAMVKLAAEEQMYLDVATGGELHVALANDFPAERIFLHGNNKSAQELRQAITAGVGRVVVDNFAELDLLELLHSELNLIAPIPVLIRVTPGIEAHTHEYIATGMDDSKFGFTVSSGLAEKRLASPLALKPWTCAGFMPTSAARFFAWIR